MVWALDLDDPTTSQSILNTKLDGLRVIGDNVDLNPDFAQKKLEATQSANNMGLLTFWTDCQADPQCPPGFKKLTEGHGKVFARPPGLHHRQVKTCLDCYRLLTRYRYSILS